MFGLPFVTEIRPSREGSRVDLPQSDCNGREHAARLQVCCDKYASKDASYEM